MALIKNCTTDTVTKQNYNGLPFFCFFVPYTRSNESEGMDGITFQIDHYIMCR